MECGAPHTVPDDLESPMLTVNEGPHQLMLDRCQAAVEVNFADIVTLGYD